LWYRALRGDSAGIGSAEKLEVNMAVKTKTAKSTKIDALIRLLSRSQGATVAQMQLATGWQPHSMRAALTGFSKKGYSIDRGKNVKGVTVYRVGKDASA
jgi:hypothetical protein